MRVSLHRSTRGFTIVELLVVIAIIALLVAILLPSLSRARTMSRRLQCLSNERQIGVAIYNYAQDNHGFIPYGPPKAPPFTTTNFYPVPGTVTSLIPFRAAPPSDLGLMLNSQLANCKHALSAPMPIRILWRSTTGQRRRHPGSVRLLLPPCLRRQHDHQRGDRPPRPADLGLNGQGVPIRALVLRCRFPLLFRPVRLRRQHAHNHHMETVNTLFSDGHAEVMDNRSGTYTVNSQSNVENSFGRILTVFENLDAAVK